MYKCNNSTILFLDLPQKHPQNDELSVPKIHAVLSFHSMLCLLWLKKQNMAQCCTCSLKDKRGNSTCDTTWNWYSQAPPLPIKDSNAFQFLQVTRQAVRFLQTSCLPLISIPKFNTVCRTSELPGKPQALQIHRFCFYLSLTIKWIQTT